MGRAIGVMALVAALLAGCSGGKPSFDEAMDKALGSDLIADMGDTATERLAAYEEMATQWCDIFDSADAEGISRDEAADMLLGSLGLAERDAQSVRSALTVIQDYRCD